MVQADPEELGKAQQEEQEEQEAEEALIPTKATLYDPRGTCGYKWNAPLVHPDHTVTSVPQVCSNPKDHEGDHRSDGNVTAPNKKES